MKSEMLPCGVMMGTRKPDPRGNGQQRIFMYVAHCYMLIYADHVVLFCYVVPSATICSFGQGIVRHVSCGNDWSNVQTALQLRASYGADACLRCQIRLGHG